VTQCRGCTPLCTLRSGCESLREKEASEMTSYTWTVDSALYQLRWEPSERRASAVEYLREIILDNENESEQVIRDIAMTLLSLNTEIMTSADIQPEDRTA
jgi:homogentisate 1,2-dioxygenase